MSVSMHVKCVVLGYPRVGKTSMLISYMKNAFAVGNLPTIFDPSDTHVLFNGSIINLQLLDTPGQKDYDRLRPLSYIQTDVFLLAFSLVSKPSFDHIVNKWIHELRYHVSNCPIILVGTKLDLRDDNQFFLENPGAVPISTAEGEELKTLVGAFAYIECSAKTQKNLKAVFDAAIKAVLESSKNITIAQDGWCSIL